MLCVGAVAFACGPRTHSDGTASTPRKNQSLALVSSKPAPVRQQGTPRAKVADPVLSASVYVRATTSAVRIAMHVANTTKKRVEIVFPSGQTYDFVILDSLGREVWRWGNGRMFTQALRNKLLSGGEAMDLEETLNAPTLAPGRYIARALLTSENYPLVEQTAFTLTPTTVAAR
jgi:hypothetical protein